MSIFFWKNNKAIDSFSNSLASELYSSVQADDMKKYFQASSKDIKKDKTLKNVEVTLLNSLKQLQQFRLTHSLGTYGKARLLMKFNERLDELGYDAATIKKLKELILIKLPG